MKWKFQFLKQEVRLLMKSGAEVRFFASKITVRSGGDNSLSQLQWENARGVPLYTRLSEIVAVRTRRVPFWASL